MARVYIVQNPMRRNLQKQLVHKYDLSPAREYGDLQVLLPAGPVLISPESSVKALREKLENFRAEDWLLCLGDPVAIAAAAAIVSEKNDGVIPVLVWDRGVEKYLAITIDTNALRNLPEGV